MLKTFPIYSIFIGDDLITRASGPNRGIFAVAEFIGMTMLKAQMVPFPFNNSRPEFNFDIIFKIATKVFQSLVDTTSKIEVKVFIISLFSKATPFFSSIPFPLMNVDGVNV